MFIFPLTLSNRSFRVAMHLLLAIAFLSVAFSTPITPRGESRNELRVRLGRLADLRGKYRNENVFGFSKKTPIQPGDVPVIFFGQQDVFWVDFDPTTTAMKLIPFPPDHIPQLRKGTRSASFDIRPLVDLGLKVKVDEWREKGLPLISDVHFPQQITEVLGRDITLETDFDCFDILLDALHHVGVFKSNKASFEEYEEVKARFKAGVGIPQEVVPPANGKGINAGKYMLG
ncbi:hypothetical protein EV359DRAFT_86645 [Lentinula novae-zelandiae]|nr:hypothetical protein EV359DRAFT_86645 [Lentinula novae-zelandiae]